MSRPKFLVVGGGVIGVSCAYALARRGADVQVLERDTLGAGASGGNAGTVSAGHPPLNRPGRIVQALTQMLDPASPLFLPPRWDPKLWQWLLGFGRYCTHEHVESCMQVMAPLGMDALHLFDDLIEAEGIECGYKTEGYFEVCSTKKGLVQVKHESSIIERHGYHPQTVSGDELRHREPAFGRDIIGGMFYPEARTLDPLRFLIELADRSRRLGVSINEGASVSEVTTAGGRATGVRLSNGDVLEADSVVLATGPFSLELAARVGTRLPVQPGKGYHRDIEIRTGGAPPLGVACVLSETSVFCTPMDGFVRFAGTMEFSGENDVMRRARLEQLTMAGRLCFPDLGHAAPSSEWCGLRPMAVDGMPIVGALDGIEDLAVATGHGMLGLTLGPVTGEMIANQVFGEEDVRLQAFSPSRFQGFDD
ncbi:MAG: NAD(P)/FAD-dependent oxidoreductase [Longimicrobiales bacterium]